MFGRHNVVFIPYTQLRLLSYVAKDKRNKVVIKFEVTESGTK
jgi:hypothetical protein